MAVEVNSTPSSRRFTGGKMSSRMQQDLLASLHRSSSSKAGGSNRRELRVRGVQRTPRVCIVGAGISGLRCADVLLRHGVDVSIFEARNRIGGRVHQVRVGGHLVDVGANWIHGATKDDPIFALARQVGTVLGQSNDEQLCFDREGHAVPDEDATDLTTIFFNLTEEGYKYSAENSAKIPASASFFDYIKEKAIELFPDEQKRRLFLDISELWGSFIGGTIYTQSLKFLWLEQCLDGDNKFLASTYEKVLNHVAEPALKEAAISLNTEVTGIKSMILEDSRSGVEIRTATGETHLFDDVVVTVPLGFLKRNKEIFDPPIPSRLSQAIDALGYGNLDKACITFPSAFWDLPASPRDCHRQQGIGPADDSRPTGDPDSTIHAPGYIHWDKPAYPTISTQMWNIEGVSLAALPEPCPHPTLLFYFAGACSEYIASRLREQPPSTPEGQQFLYDYFEPYYSRLPNWDPSDPACKPVSVLASNWRNDKFAGNGSYINFPVGLEKGDEDIVVIRNGMPERNIWLAGEHTAPFLALGTVTGAYWSGDGVAKRLLETYGVVVNS